MNKNKFKKIMNIYFLRAKFALHQLVAPPEMTRRLSFSETFITTNIANMNIWSDSRRFVFKTIKMIVQMFRPKYETEAFVA